jgi:hypothetical protein
LVRVDRVRAEATASPPEDRLKTLSRRPPGAELSAGQRPAQTAREHPRLRETALTGLAGSTSQPS